MLVIHKAGSYLTSPYQILNTHLGESDLLNQATGLPGSMNAQESGPWPALVDADMQTE